jgi:8-oxo-dGTP pyrophosphatase MutT (NUDIX family)
MRWTTHGERTVYESPWVTLRLVEVEVPGQPIYEHHVIDAPDASGVVVHDPGRGVLMMWRHRFINDAWGWEVPAGMIDPGESPEQAAVREVAEEVGWQVDEVTPFLSYFPTNGMTSQRFHLFVASGGTPLEGWAGSDEAERVEWVPVERITELIRTGEIGDGLSLVALSVALATGLI